MRRFLIGFLAVIGGIALLLVIVTGVGDRSRSLTTRPACRAGCC